MAPWNDVKAAVLDRRGIEGEPEVHRVRPGLGPEGRVLVQRSLDAVVGRLHEHGISEKPHAGLIDRCHHAVDRRVAAQGPEVGGGTCSPSVGGDHGAGDPCDPPSPAPRRCRSDRVSSPGRPAPVADRRRAVGRSSGRARGDRLPRSAVERRGILLAGMILVVVNQFAWEGSRRRDCS